MSDDIHNKLDRIETKIDKLDSRLDDNTITLTRQAKDIEHHIARTDALEDLYREVEKANKTNTEHRITQNKLLATLGAAVAFLSTVLGLVYTIAQLL
jgi:chromosome segregation ATPase